MGSTGSGANVFPSWLRPSKGGVGSTLLNGLIHYWAFEEASGDRVDTVGGANLTPVTTAGRVAGKHGFALNLVASNSEILSKSNFSLSVPNGMTWAVWLNPGTLPGATIFSMGNGAPFLLSDTDNGTYWGELGNNTTQPQNPLTTGQWSLFIGWVTSNRQQISQELNGVSGGSFTFLGAASYTATLTVGGISPYWDGAIDELMIWNRPLTAGERTELYNSGAGKFYPFS